MEKTNPADKVEQWPIDRLVPYAKNSRTHSEEQIAQIAASIKEWGFTTAVLVDEQGGIIAGHGRVLAARKLGMDLLPVMVAEGWSEPQKRAYVIADNKLAMNAGWDNELLKLELKDLDLNGFDLTLTGFGLEEMAELFDQADFLAETEDSSTNYSRKIEAPIYEITGVKPQPAQLYDRSKTEQLQAQIEAANLPDDVRAFLNYAAERHTVFNFNSIAEFYAHSDADVQDLFESSALVIIDFERAVEEGFVQLSKELLELAGLEDE